MALPLPKVVPDIAPGGGIVTAMGGINALNNAMAQTEYNKQKANLAPYTLGAEAASKLAYANLMGPQFLAKMLGNENLLAGLNEQQKAAAISLGYRAGTGQGTGNALLNIPGMQGGQGAQGVFAPNKRFSFTNWLQDQFRSKISPEEQQVNALVAPTQPQVQSNPMNSMNAPVLLSTPANEPNEAISPNVVNNKGNANENHPDIFKIAEMWQASPEGQEMIEKTGNINYLPEDSQYLIDWYKRQQQASQQETLAQKSGKFAATKKQLEKAGDLRANAVGEIGQRQDMLSATGGNLTALINDFTNPEFMALRSKFPVLQDLQLKTASHFDDPQVQHMVGKIISDLEQFKQSTVMGFKGQTLKREFEFADKLKPSEKDTVYTALGKLNSLKALHDIAEKKNALISQYLQQEINLPEAIEKANKSVDIRKIQNQVSQLTQPLHKIKNSRTGETIYLTPERFKEEGFTTEQGMSKNSASLETGKSNVNIR